ncbi:hypothetical protein IMG5_171080, partial [Ichthyophthirius multifiliis]
IIPEGKPYLCTLYFLFIYLKLFFQFWKLFYSSFKFFNSQSLQGGFYKFYEGYKHIDSFIEFASIFFQKEKFFQKQTGSISCLQQTKKFLLLYQSGQPFIEKLFYSKNLEDDVKKQLSFKFP